MESSVIFWVIAFVILSLVEFATMQLVSIWFAAGSLVALLLALLKCPLWAQGVGFFVTAIILLILTRPILKKIMVKKPVPTNVDLDIGKTAVVTEEINNEKLTGRVSLDGVYWTARSVNNEIIPENETVVVRSIDGTKFYVEKETVQA